MATTTSDDDGQRPMPPGCRWCGSAAVGLRLAALAAGVLGLLAGCAAVGPDFVRPAAPDVAGYTQGPVPRETAVTPGHGGERQAFVSGAEVPYEWWRLFHSRRLDEIVRAALAGSQDLQAAQARLREARANLEAEQGKLLPQLSVSAGAQRERITGAAFGGSRGFTLSLMNGSADVSFNPDVFGGERRAIEGQQAAEEFQRHEAQATYLTLVGNAANAAIAEAGARAEIKATRDIIASDKRALNIIESQYHVGTVAYSDVLNARSRLDATRATLPALEQQVSQNRHLLATLAGRTPAQWAPPSVDLDNLALPQQLPIGVPSHLVRQRPDILSAESQLHQASAQVGVATANLYPSFDLTASYGTEAIAAGSLFSPGAEIWSLGIKLLAPIFEGGTLRARKRAAVAAYEAALGTYQQTVLAGFQQVADGLRALQNDAQTLRARSESLRSARDARTIVEDQLRVGSAAYLDVLTAQTQYEQARIAYVSALTQRYQDTVALFTALGGGPWNRPREQSGHPRA